MKSHSDEGVAFFVSTQYGVESALCVTKGK